MIGHRIYYFINRYDEPVGGYECPVYSTEAYSEAEARIVLGAMLHVTALSLIDVTDYSK